MYQANNADLGMFEQCLNILEKLDEVTIKGRYCYGGLALPLENVGIKVDNMKEAVNIFDFKHGRTAKYFVKFKEEITRMTQTAVQPKGVIRSDAKLLLLLFGEFGIDSASN